MIAEETFWPSGSVDREPDVHKYLANLSKGKKKKLKRVKVVVRLGMCPGSGHPSIAFGLFSEETR